MTQTLPSGQVITHEMVRRWKTEPLTMILDGAFSIKTSHEFDQKTGVSVSRNKKAGPSVFYPQIEQRYLLEMRVECKRRGIPFKLVVAKARYCGVSSITAVMIIAEMLHSPTPSCNAISADPNSKEYVLYRYFESFIKNLPTPFRLKFPKFSPRQIAYEMARNSAYGIDQSMGEILIHAATMGEKTAVGTRTQWLWFTEISKMIKDEDVMRTLGETVMDTQDAFALFESTCEGQDNYHYAMFEKAWAAQGGVNFYSPIFNWDAIKRAGNYAIFFPAYMNPRRYIPFKNRKDRDALWNDLTSKEKKYMALMTEYFRQQHRIYGIPPGRQSVEITNTKGLEFILWLRAYSVGINSVTSEWNWMPDFADEHIIKQTLPKSLTMRHREIPVTVEEAFDSSVSTVFDGQLIKVYKEKAQSRFLSTPPTVGYLTEEGRFVEDSTGWIEIYLPKWELYNNDGFAPPRVYFLGGDFAHGDNPSNDTTDFSTLVAIDMKEQILSVEIKETVPNFEDKIDRVLRFLSMNYRDENLIPFTCLEAADAGRRTVQHLNEGAFPNPDRFYYSERVDQNGQPYMKRPGFDPTIRKLDIDAWKAFEVDIHEFEIELFSLKMIDQIRSLVRDTDGRLKAPKKGRGGVGSKDDLADALKLAMWYRTRILEVNDGDISFEVHGADKNGKIEIEEPIAKQPKEQSFFDRTFGRTSG